MSEEIDVEVVVGTVDNGRRAMVAFPFFSGEVGVRVIGDRLELAYFDARAWQAPALPATGTIEDREYRAIEVRRPQPRGAAVVVIAEPVEQA